MTTGLSWAVILEVRYSHEVLIIECAVIEASDIDGS